MLNLLLDVKVSTKKEMFEYKIYFHNGSWPGPGSLETKHNLNSLKSILSGILWV
jgi:hypothetical protein